MHSLFHDIPQNAATIAALRRFCDESDFPAACEQPACRRGGRCRRPWVADPNVERLRLPPCLMAVLEHLHTTIHEARRQLYDMEAAVAAIRRLPDPEAAAARSVYASAVDDDDPFGLEDWAGADGR